MAAPVPPSDKKTPEQPVKPEPTETPVAPIPTTSSTPTVPAAPIASSVPTQPSAPVKPSEMTIAQKLGPLPNETSVQPASTQSATTAPTVKSSNSLPPLPDPAQAESEKKDQEADENEDEEDEEDDDEPQVIERVIIKDKGLGCFGLIKRLTCFCLLFFLLFIAAIIALIIFKPAFITEPLKTFLNADYNPEEVSEGISNETVEGYLDEVTNPEEGEVTFQLTEDQVSSLVRSRLTDGADVRIGMEENKIQVFVDVAQNGGPLWLIIELNDSGSNLTFSRIGFGRINTPAPLREFVKDRAFSLIGSVIKDLKFNSSEELVNSLVGGELRDDVTIKDVKFSEDLVLVTVEL